MSVAAEELARELLKRLKEISKVSENDQLTLLYAEFMDRFCKSLEGKVKAEYGIQFVSGFDTNSQKIKLQVE